MEVKPGRIGAEFIGGHRIVGLVTVAAFRPVPADLRQSGLKGHDVMCLAHRIRPVRQGQHPGDIDFILGAGLGEGRFEIIVLVRQPDPAGGGIDRVARRVLAVGADGHTEQASTQTLMVAHQADQVVPAGRRADLLQISLNGRRAQGFDPGFAHEGLVEGADPGRFERRMGAGLLQDGMDTVFGQHGQPVEIAKSRPVRRNLSPGQITAIGELVEVVAGLHLAIDPRQIKAPVAEMRRRGQVDGLACRDIRRQDVHGRRAERQKHGRSGDRQSCSKVHIGKCPDPVDGGQIAPFKPISIFPRPTQESVVGVSCGGQLWG